MTDQETVPDPCGDTCWVDLPVGIGVHQMAPILVFCQSVKDHGGECIGQWCGGIVRWEKKK